MSTQKIIQWNCRGLKANYDEISLLLQQHNPIALCLQETFLKDTDHVNFRRFSTYNAYSNNVDRASGGVSIVVNAKAIHSVVPLQTNLQAVAVRITIEKTITVCSLYLPPGTSVVQTDLDDLVRQLPAPYIVLGDFNGHNTLWGSKDTNRRGKTIEDFINANNLCIFNDKRNTYLHPATGSYTAIDLSLCHPSIYLDFTWDVGDDLCGSDHFPIFFTSSWVFT